MVFFNRVHFYKTTCLNIAHNLHVRPSILRFSSPGPQFFHVLLVGNLTQKGCFFIYSNFTISFAQHYVFFFNRTYFHKIIRRNIAHILHIRPSFLSFLVLFCTYAIILVLRILPANVLTCH